MLVTLKKFISKVHLYFLTWFAAKFRRLCYETKELQIRLFEKCFQLVGGLIFLGSRSAYIGLSMEIFTKILEFMIRGGVFSVTENGYSKVEQCYLVPSELQMAQSVSTLVEGSNYFSSKLNFENVPLPLKSRNLG